MSRVGYDQRSGAHLRSRAKAVVVSLNDLVNEPAKRRQPGRRGVSPHRGAEEPVLV